MHYRIRSGQHIYEIQASFKTRQWEHLKHFEDDLELMLEEFRGERSFRTKWKGLDIRAKRVG